MTLSTLFGLVFLAAAQAPAAAPSGPERFFVGNTEGVGTVGRRAIRTRTSGRMEPDGALVLDQEVVVGSGRPRSRRWRLVRGAGNSFTGTMTEARGPVTGSAAGNVIRLRYLYRLFVVELSITVLPDGRRARNRITYSLAGEAVASGEERIRRVD